MDKAPTFPNQRLEIDLVEDSNINTHKQFLSAQKMIFDLIPKNKNGLLFNGLKSFLEDAIRQFIHEEVTIKVNKHKEDHSNDITSLKNRILKLESLCDKEGIKHTISRDDVYTKRSDGFCND